jgi:hypothetical protein
LYYGFALKEKKPPAALQVLAVIELPVLPYYEYRQVTLCVVAGCAIFSTNVAEASSAHDCLILKPAAILKAIIHFTSRIALLLC